MSTKPRLTPVQPNQVADFGSVTAHASELMQRFFSLYGDFWSSGEVAAEVKELTRIRNARQTDCGY